RALSTEGKQADVVTGRQSDTAMARAFTAARKGVSAAILYAIPLVAREESAWPSGQQIEESVAALIAFGQGLARLAAPGAPSPRVFILTHDAHNVDGASDGLAQSALIGAARTLAVECPDVALTLADIDEAALAGPKRLAQALAAMLSREEYIMRGGNFKVARLAARGQDDIALRKRAAAQLPRQTNFALTPQRPHGLATLTWQDCGSREPAAGEVRVRVSAAGLNFRDVMAATGLLPKDAEKDAADAALGLEFAGIVERIGEEVNNVRVGDRVFGMARGCLRQGLTIAADRIYRVPDNLRDEAAAAIPSVYLTAHYALNHLARVRAGERVLIHSGAGGVGLAAIALAQRSGAEIYATAGTPEKRAYLQSLGVRAVMDSRSLQFAEDVRTATGGEGVDVVLNALPGPFIEKGLACLAPSGRFIELGKRDVYDDRALGLRALRRNISLHVVDLAALLDERPALICALMNELIGLFSAGEIAPPPLTVFPASQTTDAFRYFANAKHIGKIVIDLRDPDTPVQASPDAIALDPRASYLVTGGLSGFGFAIARDLAQAGAGRVVLASRSGVTGDEVTDEIASLRVQGADIDMLALDVADKAAVDRLIRDLNASDKPLKGIVHAAVAYDDAPLERMTPARIGTAFAPKVAGGLNLTQAVLDGGLKLDFFLSLSSLAQVIGWRGQSNYAAANAFLDSLARRQRALGIPGVCLNLGMLGEAGFVARSEAMTDFLESAGWRPLSNGQALQAVRTALASEAPTLTYAAADWPRLRASEPALAASPRLAGMMQGAGGPAAAGQLLPHVEPTQRPAHAEASIRREIAAVLRLDADRIEARRPLNDIGLDSLSSFELWNRIEAALGLSIPLPRFVEAATLDALVKLACSLADECARTAAQRDGIAAEAMDQGVDAPDLLPRERRLVEAETARMTSDHGRRALEVALAVTAEPAVAPADVCAAWQAVLPTDLEPHVQIMTTPSGNGSRIVLRVARQHLDGWSAALVMEALLARLGGAPAEMLKDCCEQRRVNEINQLTGANRTRHLAFWSEMLKQPPGPIPFARRSRALAPVGFGLNRGPTARIAALKRADGRIANPSGRVSGGWD
ncbi:MAG TPA: SDR family NAD(P)-dependent oxidoreductase, partial [Pseudolabrys sp.]|nr:SDR family NAD(P)-dependent oxidoreductase [Pseudolabrys sp.]